MERRIFVKAETFHGRTIELCDKSSVDAFGWSQPESDKQRLLKKLLQTRSSAFVKNVDTDIWAARIGDHVFPVTVSDGQYGNSWVCSPYNATITYPLDELREVNNAILRKGLAGLIRSFAPLLKAAKINHVVGVNNWLLSTNLYPTWDGEGVEQLTAELCSRWPQHAILFRSLNRVSNGPLLERLQANGYLLAPSRQVYLCSDLSAAARRQNSEIDRALLRRQTKYRVVFDDTIQDSDIPRIVELYDHLYLQKYSVHNPQFTEELIRVWRQTGFMKLLGLRNRNDILDGIVGCFAMDGVMTTPLLGYDLKLPRQLGLYRLLTVLVFREAQESGQLLNLSAGAAQFKRHRGGEAELEFSAIFVKHLSFARQAVWKSLAALLTHVGARILQAYQL